MPVGIMAQLRAVHAFSSLIVIAAGGNLVLAAWAWIAHLRRRTTLSSGFWLLVWVLLLVLVIQVAAGLLLAAGGARPKTWLHFLYGILVTTAGVLQFGLRPGGFLRPTGGRAGTPLHQPRYLALICLTQMGLIIRAYTTGALGR